MHSAPPEQDRRSSAQGVPFYSRRFEGIVTGAPLGRLGSLEVRIATQEAEIATAQAVRYRVFFEELGAKADLDATAEQRDSDQFDAICDHLLVCDTSIEGTHLDQIVGTYRLLRQESAAAAGGFYSNGEFALDALVARHPSLRFLELGRSCVLPAYRSKRTIEVLWQGIWAYINHYSIGVMTGCASFHGTDPAAHAEALSFLAHHCRPDPEWDVRAVPERYVSMDMMPKDAVNMRAAMNAMPPLIKGYLRLGAKIGDGCVVDHDFGTTDVFIILPVSALSERYLNYYSSDSSRFAA